ncbi:MAG: hypothetical protein ABSF15_06040 [Candidatus Sulfotelmatobacter sp.]
MAIRSRSSGKENLDPMLVHQCVRWLMPSIGDLIFVALLGLLTFTSLSVRLLGDAGIGWHIRTGQLILATHAIPHADPFSSTMAGRPWFAWEWLYDVLVGWLDSIAGLHGVVFFTALIIAVTFSSSFRLLLRWSTNFLVALALVLLGASASMIHFFTRPHVVSWLFTVLWFWVLESSERQVRSSSAGGRRHFLWLLPVVMLVWVALQKIGVGRLARTLLLVGMFSALATLANPDGWKLHLHIYRYLSNRFLMDRIDEFQSPNFHGVAQKCFAALLVLAFVAVAARRRESSELRASGILVALFAMLSGLYASRNIPVSALLMILVIGPWLSDAAQNVAEGFSKRRNLLTSQGGASPHFAERMQAMESSLRGHLWPIMAVVLAGWIASHGGRVGMKPLMHAHFDGKRFPIAAVDYVARHDVRMIHATRTVEPGPVFAPDSWGGYLIYRLYPQIKVAVDDRHDFYGEQFLKSYLKTLHAEPGWQNFFEQYPVRYVVLPTDSALATLLAVSPNWQRAYGDDLAVIFVPASVVSTASSNR